MSQGPRPAPSFRSTSFQLVAFDVDGTLVKHADNKVIWQLLNRRFGGDAEENNRRFSAYLSGEITYPQWVQMDIGDWVQADARKSQIQEVIRRDLHLVPGAREALHTLRDWGYRLAVISGTLDIVLDELFPQHPFEEVFTNTIWFDAEERIQGWKATPYDMEGKARALEQIAQRMQVPLEQTVYVGDHINDIQVMGRAGLAVAFEPKTPQVEQAAAVVLRQDMRGLLDVLNPARG